MIMMKKVSVAVGLFLACFFSAGFSFAQMTSSNYKINADSLNAGGRESIRQL